MNCQVLFKQFNANESKLYKICFKAPKLAHIPSRDQNEGSLFSIMCSLQEGSPPFFFEWSKNGRAIKSSPEVNYKIEISDSFSLLSIKKLIRNDSANYTCTVKNTVGSDAQHFLLTVKGIWNLIFN